MPSGIATVIAHMRRFRHGTPIHENFANLAKHGNAVVVKPHAGNCLPMAIAVEILAVPWAGVSSPKYVVSASGRWVPPAEPLAKDLVTRRDTAIVD